MANGWASAPPQWSYAPQAQPSGLRKAAPILLLVGAIMAAVGALMIIVMALMMGALFSAIAEDTGAPEFGFIFGFYGIYGLLLAAGSVCSFVAWGKANRNDLQGAFVWGLVGSLLPPLNIVALLGAIFAKVCPEGEAQARRMPPQVR